MISACLRFYGFCLGALPLILCLNSGMPLFAWFPAACLRFGFPAAGCGILRFPLPFPAHWIKRLHLPPAIPLGGYRFHCLGLEFSIYATCLPACLFYHRSLPAWVLGRPFWVQCSGSGFTCTCVWRATCFHHQVPGWVLHLPVFSRSTCSAATTISFRSTCCSTTA